MKIKRTIFVQLIAFVALFLTGQVVEAQQKTGKSTSQVTFSVDIDCMNCVKKLEAKLPFEKGVKDLKISLDNHTVWFEYQPEKTDKEKLAKAIEKLGYKAEEIVAEANQKK